MLWFIDVHSFCFLPMLLKPVPKYRINLPMPLSSSLALIKQLFWWSDSVHVVFPLEPYLVNNDVHSALTTIIAIIVILMLVFWLLIYRFGLALLLQSWLLLQSLVEASYVSRKDFWLIYGLKQLHLVDFILCLVGWLNVEWCVNGFNLVDFVLCTVGLCCVWWISLI